MTNSWSSDAKDDLVTETVWEREMMTTGFNNYEVSKLKSDGTQKASVESGAGQKLIRQLMVPLVPAITKLQKEAHVRKRVKRSNKATLLLLKPDTMALITVVNMVNRTHGVEDTQLGTNHQALIQMIGRAIELEVTFMAWIKNSRVQAREYAKDHGLKSTPVSFAEKFMQGEGASRFTIKRAREDLGNLVNDRWTLEQLQYVGDDLLLTACRTLPETFESFTVPISQRTQKSEKRVRMTPSAIEKFNQVEDDIARSRVVKRPMLSKPNKWRPI